MATLAKRDEGHFIKMLLLGESKTGKTGSLASLVTAGYKILILDFDNGLDYLAAQITADDPKLLSNVYYATFRDKTKLTSTRDVVPVSRPKAFADALKTLDDGIDDSGIPSELGPDWVVVVDSLWSAGRAAYLEHGKLQPTRDPRQTYGGAQKMLMAMLENLTDPTFRAHVICITHMSLIELDSGVTKGLPAAIGKAICAEIPKLFNRMLVCEVKGAGKSARRVIATVPTSLTIATSGELKGKIPASLPIETGMADFFEAILGAKK